MPLFDKDDIKTGRGLRRKTTTYGQKGGDGPNTGKKAIVFTATASDGTELKRRFFNFDFPDLNDGVAAILKPTNNNGWHINAVAPSIEQMPSWVNPDFGHWEFQPCKRVEKKE